MTPLPRNVVTLFKGCPTEHVTRGAAMAAEDVVAGRHAHWANAPRTCGRPIAQPSLPRPHRRPG